MRPHYISKTVEEVSHSLCGIKLFSKLDARSGYWAAELDHAASLLTIFNTHQGRYRFKRLPFGLKLLQNVFQEHMEQMFRQLSGIINIADDITISGTILSCQRQCLLARHTVKYHFYRRRVRRMLDKNTRSRWKPVHKPHELATHNGNSWPQTFFTSKVNTIYSS